MINNFSSEILPSSNLGSENQLYKAFSSSKLVYTLISAILQFEKCNYSELFLMVLTLCVVCVVPPLNPTFVSAECSIRVIK